jgi:hypothetical protein
MRFVTILLIAACVSAFSCSKPAEETNKTAPASGVVSSPSPAGTSQARGGRAPKEAGDTSPETFEGVAGVTEVKRLEMEPVVLKEIRTGSHPQFDRVVFEFQGDKVPGYRVEFVKQPLVTCGAGDAVQVNGSSFLSVRLLPAQAHTNDGKATIKQREFAPDMQVIKQLKSLCDFEADVQWVLGLSSPNNYRVLELLNPSRLVIDVRH